MSSPSRSEKISSLIAPEAERNWRPLTFRVSPELAESLDRLAEREGVSVDEILVRAIALYRFLSERHQEGKHIGVNATGENFDLEINFP